MIGPTGKRLSSQVIETNGRSLLTVVRAVPGTRHLIFEKGNLATCKFAELAELARAYRVVMRDSVRAQNRIKGT